MRSRSSTTLLFPPSVEARPPVPALASVRYALRHVLCLATLALAVAGCDSNPFDAAEVPVVTVRAGSPPLISWAPSGAQLVRVYRGDRAGDGYTPDLVWELQAADGQNGLRGPVAYGEVPDGAEVGRSALGLVAGETYTAWVRRYDEAGTGDGFTNTRNAYVGEASFVAE